MSSPPLRRQQYWPSSPVEIDPVAAKAWLGAMTLDDGKPLTVRELVTKLFSENVPSWDAPVLLENYDGGTDEIVVDAVIGPDGSVRLEYQNVRRAGSGSV